MRRRYLAALATTVLLAVPAVAGAASADATDPYRDPALPLQTRVDDLVGRLTLDEKVSLLHQYQPAISRLGIAQFKSGTEALHGVAWSNDAAHSGAVVTADGTSFAQAPGLASTWNPELIKQVGAAVGDEARGFHAENPTVFGLNLWAPVVNPLRDPRWGRNEEGYSEDPYLTGAIATAYGQGLQGDDPAHLRTAPTLKHYLAYNNETQRDTVSSNVPNRVLNEYDRQVFRAPLEANAATGVMASYNLVNGRPATVDPDLAALSRGWSDYPLFNVTDAAAPTNLVGSQKYYSTQAEADAAAIKAGLNSFTVNDASGANTVTAVKSALSSGLLTEADVNTAVGQALSIRFRLGEFDPDGGPYAGVGADVIDNAAHRQLARQTADQAMVLLKNDQNALPLPAGGKVAVVGPLADTLYSDWYGGKLPYQVTAVDGITEQAGSVTASEGLDRIALKANGKYLAATGTGDANTATVSATTATAAAQFDVADWGQDVLTLRNAGNAHYLGRLNSAVVTRDEQPNGWNVQQQWKLEAQSDGAYVLHYVGYDGSRYVVAATDGTLTLASSATSATHFTRELVRSGVDEAVAAAKSADTAVVVVGSNPFITGREAHDRTSLALGAGQQALVEAVYAANPHTVVVLQTSYPETITWLQQNVPAVVWTTHAGAETGHAIADVLYGAYNPAGRLTQTWPASVDQLPADLTNYDIITSGQTYLYSTGQPLYPFGYGLSYTSFAYGTPLVGDSSVTLTVTNTGQRAGDEVVQLYTHQRTSRDQTAVKQLRAFQRVHLEAGQSQSVSLPLAAADLAHWDVTRDKWVVESSVYDVLIGASSSDIRQSTTKTVAGETIPARDLSVETRAENFDAYAPAVRLVDESKAAGTAVAGVQAGDWVSFKGAGLIGGTAFSARTAKGTTGTGTVEVRLDSPTGQLLGTAQVAATGSVYTYATSTATLTAASGAHDVYLVLSAGVRLATFSIR
jgi:beta-glucosidase